MTTSGTKKTIISVIAVAAVIILAILAFTMKGKAEKAAEGVKAAEEAASAYASALAESTARVNETLSEKQTLEKQMSEAEKPGEADYSGEAELYSAFTAGDGSIRSALTALSQDDPDLIKNYRIRVDLRNMETVKINGVEGRRVRFEGRFVNPVTRKNAVIRVNGVGGTYSGKLYVTNILFDDTKALDLSGLETEDVSSSHGSALRSASFADLNGQKAVVCETEYTGNSETDNVSVQIPFGTLDSASLSTVYYDLYFEGTDSDLQFNTGCDFTGKDDISADLDAINSAFAIYRGKEAAGQESGEAKAGVTAAIEKMKKDISVYQDSDPLVIIINDLLDNKSAVIDGSDVNGSSNGDTAGEKESGKEGSGEDGKDIKDISGGPVNTGSGYVPTGNGETSVGVIPVILIILISILAIALIIVLAATSGPIEEDVEIPDREEEMAVKIREEVENERARIRNLTVGIGEKVEALHEEMADCAVDTSGVNAVLDEVNRSIAELEELFKGIREVSEDAGDEKNRSTIKKELKDLTGFGESLTKNLDSLAAQLDETNRSVTDINKAATIIADVASETNLLSLNASIEAARAGEAGRGFAVVAGEIQKLADQTERSVSEISDTVEQLNSDFERTRNYMDTIRESADAQSEKLTAVAEEFRQSEDSGTGGRNTSEYRESIRECEGKIQELRKHIIALSSEADELNKSSGRSSISGSLLADIKEELGEI